MLLRRVAACLVVNALLLPGWLLSQQPAASTTLHHDSVYQFMRRLEPDPAQAATVRNVVLEREGIRLELQEGTLWFARPLGDRVVAAMFTGRGRATLTPPSKVEQGQMKLVLGDSTLDAPLDGAFLLFADSTADELRSSLTFGPVDPSSDAKSIVNEAFDYLRLRDEETIDPGVLLPLLNGTTSDLFYAHVDRRRGGPVILVVDPNDRERVQLRARARGVSAFRATEGVSQFDPSGAPAIGDAAPGPVVSKYVMDVRIDRSAMGEARFSAQASMDITSPVAAGPWVPFFLATKLEIDSARTADGTSLPFYKHKDGSMLWLLLPAPLEPGETLPVVLHYRGDLIDRYGDFFFIKSSTAWYPRPLDVRSYSQFDLTFHTPENYRFASVGELVDSAVTDRMLTTHWVSRGPMRNASFNFGLFDDDYRIDTGDGPPVTVFYSDRASREMGVLPISKAKERVGQDVSESLRFFSTMFGPLLVKHVYATQIPYAHGEAFPGLIHLSFITFAAKESGRGDFDQFFRAHEVAHQWFGIGVDFATYRDQWLSEGMASYAGLWYTQVAQKKNDYYFDELRRWRADLDVRRNEVGPIALGYRTASPRDGSEYDLVVYRKGAWVVHMLRVLLLDLRTMSDDRFTAALRDFYQTYQGKRASTEDFRHVMERHAGADLGWFFDQWIRTSAMPEYRWAWRTEPAPDGRHRVFLRVEQRGVPDDFLAYVPVTIKLAGGQEGRLRVKVTGAQSEMELAPMPSAPQDVVFNDLEGVLAKVSKVSW